MSSERKAAAVLKQEEQIHAENPRIADFLLNRSLIQSRPVNALTHSLLLQLYMDGGGVILEIFMVGVKAIFKVGSKKYF